MHNYDAQHRAGQIISPITLQTITIAQICLLRGEGAECHLHKGGGQRKGGDKSTERGSVHDEK